MNKSIMKSENIYIGLTNPKSATNVGAVMRAAGCFSVDRVLYSGERYDRSVKLNTDTKKINSIIPLQHADDFIASVPGETKIICVDLVIGATALPNFIHPENALYIFGPEDGSIKQNMIDKADEVVYIPTKGCLNLAATVNILLYDRLAKSKIHLQDDILIKESRDRNNRTELKQVKNDK